MLVFLSIGEITWVENPAPLSGSPAPSRERRFTNRDLHDH